MMLWYFIDSVAPPILLVAMDVCAIHGFITTVPGILRQGPVADQGFARGRRPWRARGAPAQTGVWATGGFCPFSYEKVAKM